MPYDSAVPTARFLAILPLILFSLACNRNQQGVICAPLSTVTLVRVSQNGSSKPRQSVIADRYHIQALVHFANGRRHGFSARRTGIPVATTSATFYNGARSLLTFSSGANFFSLRCSGYAGVEEANRVQIAEFQRLVAAQP